MKTCSTPTETNTNKHHWIKTSDFEIRNFQTWIACAFTWENVKKETNTNASTERQRKRFRVRERERSNDSVGKVGVKSRRRKKKKRNYENIHLKGSERDITQPKEKFQYCTIKWRACVTCYTDDTHTHGYACRAHMYTICWWKIESTMFTLEHQKRLLVHIYVWWKQQWNCLAGVERAIGVNREKRKKKIKEKKTNRVRTHWDTR